MSSNITRGSFSASAASSSNNSNNIHHLHHHHRHQEQQQQQQGLSHFHGFSSASARTISSSSTCSNPSQQETLPPPAKKKRNLPGTPDPSAEVIALSPKTLLATNRFVCEVCNKGFQRDQNLQLHRRGHNLPWKLKQKNRDEVRKKVYICPEPSCVHHNPARALGDLTGIKKHYCRKHGEKKWKCEKCSKKYAVQADWKAHSKICGTREYKCDCGTIFSRRDSFITHRAFCDVLAEENNKAMNQGFMANMASNIHQPHHQIPQFLPSLHVNTNPNLSSHHQIQISNHHHHFNPHQTTNNNDQKIQLSLPQELMSSMPPKPLSSTLFSKEFSPSSSTTFHENHGLAQLSATSLLEKAAQLGAIASSSNNNNSIISPMIQSNFGSSGTILQNNCFENQGQVMAAAAASSGLISSQLFVNGRVDHHHHQNVNSEIDDAMLKSLEKEEEEAKSRFNGGQGFQLGNNRSFGGHGSEGMNMMTTVDFLGIGGERRGNGLYGQGQQMMNKMEFEGIGEAINGGLNHHHHHLQ